MSEIFYAGLLQSNAAKLLSAVWPNIPFNITIPIHGVHDKWPESKGRLLAIAPASCAAAVLSADDRGFFPGSAFAPS